MKALWSEGPNCSHNVSQKVKRIRCFSEKRLPVILLTRTVRGFGLSGEVLGDGILNVGA